MDSAVCMPMKRKKARMPNSPAPHFAMPPIHEDHLEKVFDPNVFTFGLGKKKESQPEMSPALHLMQSLDTKSQLRPKRASAEQSVLFKSLHTNTNGNSEPLVMPEINDNHGAGSGAGGPAAPVESSQEEQSLCEGSNSAVSMELSEPIVENGETEMSPEESWEHKEEISEAEPGVGSLGDGRPPEESAHEMMEEEEEIPKPKSVVAPPGAPKKEHVNVVFIGHVDAGKSTIGGQIMYLTGMVDKRTLEKYEREAKEKNRETWYLSWALDTNQEERDKGKTVEVGRAYFETEKKHFTILDAPGHKSFVPNMIGGASQADLAVLVISARKGEFETGFEKGGQTREHAMLAKTAGVKHLIVLINKMDDPTVNWSNERYEECKEKLVPFLKKVGFNPKKDIHFMPCSGLTGANLKEQSDFCPWYIGLPLFHIWIICQTSIDQLMDQSGCQLWISTRIWALWSWESWNQDLFVKASSL